MSHGNLPPGCTDRDVAMGGGDYDDCPCCGDE